MKRTRMGTSKWRRACGEAIQVCRDIEPWSQEEFAAEVDTTQSSLSRWDRGVSVPDLEQVLRICHRVGWSLAEFEAEINRRLEVKYVVSGSDQE